MHLELACQWLLTSTKILEQHYATIVNQQNPILAKMIRTLLDVQTGTASKEEIKEFRDMLEKIEKKLG